MKKIIAILALIVVVATGSIFVYKMVSDGGTGEHHQESGDISQIDSEKPLAKDVIIESVPVNNKADHININNRHLIYNLMLYINPQCNMSYNNLLFYYKI